MATALLALFIALVAMMVISSIYVRKATEYLRASEAPWDRLYESAKTVIRDPKMPRELVAISAASVMCAGCGCLTIRILFDHFLRSARRDAARKAHRDCVYEGLTLEQRAAFSRVVTNAIYYDSLRAPFFGFLLRRLVSPWLRAASEEKEFVPERGRVASMAESARTAISHRREGKRFLQMAH